MAEWNPDNQQPKNTSVMETFLWILDKDLPKLTANMQFINYANISHSDTATNQTYVFDDVYKSHGGSGVWYSYNTQEPGATYLTPSFNKMIYYNVTSNTIDIRPYQTELSLLTFEHDFVRAKWMAALNTTIDKGIGVWRSGSPYWRNANQSSNKTKKFDINYNYISPEPVYGIMAYGIEGYIRNDIVIWYIGNQTEIANYFANQTFSLSYDNLTGYVNVSKEKTTTQNITIKVTGNHAIGNAVLYWTNSSGMQNFTMNISWDGEYAQYTVENLLNTVYNYSFYVNASDTTIPDAEMANSVVSWVNFVDTVPPASITNLQNTTTSTSINWTWTDPADADFDHVEVYLNGTFKTNVSEVIQYYLNSSLQPNTWYQIGTHTVDTSGNVNQTWVNQTTRNPILTSLTTTWWNSITNDDSLVVHVNSTDSIEFGLGLATITTANWTLDSVVQSETSANFTTSLNSLGVHSLSAYGTIPTGVTQTVTWQLLSKRVKSGASDETALLNDTWFDGLTDSMNGSSPDFTQFIGAIVAPYTTQTQMGALFYVFIYILPLVIIWLRQEKVLIPSGLLGIFGLALLPMLPEEWRLLAGLCVVLTSFGIVYSLFKERG